MSDLVQDRQLGINQKVAYLMEELCMAYSSRAEKVTGLVVENEVTATWQHITRKCSRKHLCQACAPLVPHIPQGYPPQF